MVKMIACDISIQKNLFDCLALHGAVTAYDIVIRTYNLVTLESHYEAKMRIHFMAIGFERELLSLRESLSNTVPISFRMLHRLRFLNSYFILMTARG